MLMICNIPQKSKQKLKLSLYQLETHSRGYCIRYAKYLQRINRNLNQISSSPLINIKYINWKKEIVHVSYS